MPITFERDDIRHRILWTLSGVVTADEVVGSWHRQVQEGIWHYASIYDSTDELGAPSANDLRRYTRELEQLIAEQGPRGRVALVAPRDVRFGTGRMFEAFAEGEEGSPFRVFRTRAEADAWLDETLLE